MRLDIKLLIVSISNLPCFSKSYSSIFVNMVNKHYLYSRIGVAQGQSTNKSDENYENNKITLTTSKRKSI